MNKEFEVINLDMGDCAENYMKGIKRYKE